MRTLPIRECYTNGKFLVYNSGIYKIVDKKYYVFFVANKNKVIKDIALYPLESVKKELFSINICGEVFTLVK